MRGKNVVTLLTGATGALGSEILKQLIERGDSIICLARGKGAETPSERIRRIVGDSHFSTVNGGIVDGDITKPLCGISLEARAEFRGRVKRVVHSAASISFGNLAEAEAANVLGVQNILALAEDLGVREFHHVSTAYVGGAAAEFSEDEVPSELTHPHRNAYEETKQKGEALVRAWASMHQSRKYSIYRPSILIGREDGTTPTYDAYYAWFYPINQIAEVMRALQSAGKTLPDGVTVDGNGVVDIPLVLFASPTSTLNLVPVDWVAEMIALLTLVPAENKVYHLVNENPPPVRWVIKTSLWHLKIRMDAHAKIRIVGSAAEQEEALTAQSPLVARLQRQRLRPVLEQYIPYTTYGPHFRAGNARAALGGLYRTHLAIGDSYLGALLAYALSTNWGLPREREKDNGESVVVPPA